MELADDQHEYDTCMKYIRRGTASLFESNILAEEFLWDTKCTYAQSLYTRVVLKIKFLK